MRNLKLDVELFQRRLEMKKAQWNSLLQHFSNPIYGCLLRQTPENKVWWHLRTMYLNQLQRIEAEQMMLEIELDRLELDARTL